MMTSRTLIAMLMGLLAMLIACNAPQKADKQAKSTMTELTAPGFHAELSDYMDNLIKQFSEIPDERKAKLKEIAAYVRQQKADGESAQLTFICTHNSRRSHMSQVWAMTAAHHYGIGEQFRSYSGGTEATAFNENAIAALERAGFKINNPGGENPHVMLSAGNQIPEMECFSKTYDDIFNPASDFAAVMTCSDADKNCPIVPGAEERFSIPYVDPKVSDGTPEKASTYDTRCAQIGREMFYLMSQIN